MIAIPCKLCGHNNFTFLFDGKDRWHHLPGVFKLYRCHHCGFILIHPPLSDAELAKYYPEDYYSFNNAQNLSPVQSKSKKILFYSLHPIRALNCLLYSKLMRQNDDVSVGVSSRVLDIGCGDGRYLLAKRRLSCKCFGVDINPKALERLREQDPAISTYCGNVWEAGYSDNFFDLINVCHVLEHINPIDRLLAEVGRILKPEGCARIQVPNTASVTFALFGKCWMPLEVPRHVSQFSTHNLKTLFHRYGFQIEKCRTIENSFSLLTSCLHVYNELSRQRFEVMRLNRIWDSEILKLLLFPYSFCVNLLGVGDIAEFILTKSVGASQP